MDVSHFVYAFINGHLSIYIISTFLVIVNNAAMNISLQIFV